MLEELLCCVIPLLLGYCSPCLFILLYLHTQRWYSAYHFPGILTAAGEITHCRAKPCSYDSRPYTTTEASEVQISVQRAAHGIAGALYGRRDRLARVPSLLDVPKRREAPISLQISKSPALPAPPVVSSLCNHPFASMPLILSPQTYHNLV